MLSAKDAYDQLASEYDSHYIHPMWLAEDQVMIAALKRAVSFNGRVLDLGCGTGFLLKYIPLRYEQYMGIDISPNMIAQAKKLHPRNLFCIGNMEAMPFIADSSVHSVVSLFGSFSYSLPPQKVVREIARTLLPGGRFFIMAYGQRYSGRKSYICNENSIRVESRLYTAEGLRSLFQVPGLCDLRVTGFHALAESVFQSRSQEFLRRYLALEMKTLGNVRPNACYFQIITGRKSCIAN